MKKFILIAMVLSAGSAFATKCKVGGIYQAITTASGAHAQFCATELQYKLF